jgi:hypothetical protein
MTMALGGLWHGAAWHFVTWGIGHGILLIGNREVTSSPLLQRRVPRWLAIGGGWAATQVAVLMLWALFRASSDGGALSLWRHMVGLDDGRQILSNLDRWTVLVIAAGVLLVQAALQRFQPRRLIQASRTSIVLRPAYVMILVLLAAQFASINTVVHRFIYFQF